MRGTPPAAGIDLEPDRPEQRIKNVRIVDSEFVNNEGEGIKLHGKKSAVAKLEIRRNVFRNNRPIALKGDYAALASNICGNRYVSEEKVAGRPDGLYAYYVQLVSPVVAGAATTALVIGMVVFGGLGTLWGPVLGALLLYGLSEGLRFIGVVYNLIAVGFVIMVFVIFFPRGLAGFLALGFLAPNRLNSLLPPEHPSPKLKPQLALRS